MDTILDLQEKYKEYRNFIEVESKKDPETEPFKSKYKAIAVLMEMKEVITKKIDSMSKDDSEFVSYQAKLSVVLYLIGYLSVETEETHKGEENFKTCFESIPDHHSPDFVLVSINVRNQLGMLWCRRSQHNDAQTWLEGAEKLYKDYKSQTEKIPKCFHDHFKDTEENTGEKEMEMVHTLTKFYLAQIYGINKDLLKSAIYCHETLRRQLVHEEYDPIDWALNSATLSQFFMERLLFKQARHHLAAASYMLDTHEENIKNMTGSEEEIEAKKEELRHRSADVSRCWSKYGIFILEHSKNLLSNPNEHPVEEKNEDLEKLWFDSLDLSLYENEISDSPVLLFEDARNVFLITQKHLNKAKEYYSLDDRASDHVQIVQDHSQLFKHLTAFENDEERQWKMMKKRTDMLEVVLKELNPKYYLDVCRQLWYELGDTYHDIMQIRFEKVNDSTNVPTPQVLKKINALAESSMSNFNNFLDSIKDKKTQELPETLPEDLIGPTLMAHFYLGRLYYKYITPDKRKQVENISKAYECYKYLVDYCEKSEKAREAVGEILGISKEMMTLLQMKIAQTNIINVVSAS